MYIYAIILIVPKGTERVASMAHIKDVRFEHVGKTEGCQCDNCGKWITNIVTVEFQEGERLHFGTDCYSKRITGKLNSFGKKEMNKVLKKIQEHSDLAHQLTQDEPTEEVQTEWKSYNTWQPYWKDKTFNEWKQWMLTEVVPDWAESDRKQLARFSKINF